MADKPVLIAGAGPTGLVLALALARRNVPFRLISAASGPGESSRAMAVHARTLEFYRQFGFAEAVVAQGIPIRAIHVREVGDHGLGREVTAVGFQDIGGPISPYPFVLSYAQDDHEQFLIQQLLQYGVQVEWQAALAGFEQDQDGVRAQVRHADGRIDAIAASYICGCDGAHSQVRHSLGLTFAGGTYDQRFHVADVRLDGPFETDLRVNLGAEILELVLPVRSTGMNRLIGLVPPVLSEREELTFEDIRGHVEPLIGRRVAAVNWFSTYRVHHRVAERFRVGRAFLAGDAGHVHSPAGGQGMNTGIGDAVNLGWKLAQVWHGRAPDSLLDTYDSERIAFARQLVATTDRAFRLIVAKGLGGELIRRIVAPAVVGTATRFDVVRRAMFRTVSQVQIRYPDSVLSRGHAGQVRGGDRLPWTGHGGADNFASLQSLDWQVHVYGPVPEALQAFCLEAGLPLQGFGWDSAAAAAGLVSGAACLVRPDGYVAVAATGAEAVPAFASFVQERGLRFTARVA
ncbi:MAG: FAD-dependent monooxygenase [Acetobacteraceae bacterium]